MSPTIRVIALAFALLAPFSNVFAEAEPGQAYGTIMGSYVDDEVYRRVDEAIGVQLGVGFALNKSWNLEAIVMAANPNGNPGQSQRSFGADLQYVFGRDSKFSPYLLAGAAYQLVEKNDDQVNGTALSAGLGFRWDIFGSSRISLQGEYRYRRDNALGLKLDDQIVSVGLHIPFGSEKEPPAPAYVPPPDSDGDGVIDANDQCPGTPAGVSVDARGCPPDSDGDGVPDHKDQCPGTVHGAAVNSVGCEMDGDNDGVVDRLDQCPNTRAGAQVDVKGCEIKEAIQLQGVNFETNSDRLLPGAEQILDDAAASLVRNPTIHVEVAGHTDSQGAADYNEGLSERRAITVRDYLVSHGVSADRMTVKGYGEAEPIADNSTAAGRAQNRRVVLRITQR
ncbi:MAG: OmpA family protein [Woeseiaceae bacterium]